MRGFGGKSQFGAGQFFDADHFRFDLGTEFFQSLAVGLFGNGDRLAGDDSESGKGTGNDEVRPVSLEVPDFGAGDTERDDGASGLSGEEDDSLFDMPTRAARTVGSDEDGTPFGFLDELPHGLGTSPRGGASDGMDADVFHEVGEDRAVLMLADEGDAPARPEEGFHLGGAEEGKEDLIVPKAVDELLSGIGIGDIGAGRFTADLHAEEATQSDEGKRRQPGCESNESTIPNFHDRFQELRRIPYRSFLRSRILGIFVDSQTPIGIEKFA